MAVEGDDVETTLFDFAAQDFGEDANEVCSIADG